MSAVTTHLAYAPRAKPSRGAAKSIWRQNVDDALRSPRIVLGGGLLLLIVGTCLVTLFWTLDTKSDLYYDNQFGSLTERERPSWSQPAMWFGTDTVGRSMLGRCLLGGIVSLSVGLASAVISVVIGVTVGMISGFRGGWIDATLMRIVDILYGLPYLLLVILMKMALGGSAALTVGWWPDVLLFVFAGLVATLTLFARAGDPGTTGVTHDARRWRVKAMIFAACAAAAGVGAMHWLPHVPMTMGQTNIVVLFLAIGLVSWLTMARVIRGQVLSLRSQPYVEAARAMGFRESRIFLRHILPNLVGPITVYTTLTIPQAILQESFLSFLGLGVLPPVPSWGGLASENRLTALDTTNPQWWMLTFPCIMLALTLLSLNFLGDGLRDIVDPKREAAKL